jgi:hypothetical protein
MDSLDAAMRAVVYGYPGGAVALARALGMRPHVLNNKVNPHMGHHLTLEEAVRIQREARDCRILFEEARLLGYCCMAVGRMERVSGGELLTAWADWHTALGQTATAIKAALASGRVTKKAINRIRLEMVEDMRCEWTLLRHVESLCDEPQAQAI